MYPQVTDEDYIHRFKDDGSLRVTINTIRGTFPAFGIAYSTESLSMKSLPSCPPNLPPCDPYEVINYLGSRISVTRPLEHAAFVFLRVKNGYRRRWQDQVSEVAGGLGDREDVFLAAAHLFGRGRYNGVLEIMANDEDVFHDLLLTTTDLEGVRLVDPHFVTADSQRGMGDPER